uniref:SCP domain-containing protein n=1 Tax=Macrostomum lignano TaxID=282301 RepID=A0A1I8FIY2_9PLAT
GPPGNERRDFANERAAVSNIELAIATGQSFQCQHAGHTALLVACPFKQNSCDLDAQHQLKSIQPQKELHFKEEEEHSSSSKQQQHACPMHSIQKCNFESSSAWFPSSPEKVLPGLPAGQIERALGDTINGVDQNDSDRILTAAKEGGAAPETPFVITLCHLFGGRRHSNFMPECARVAIYQVPDSDSYRVQAGQHSAGTPISAVHPSPECHGRQSWRAAIDCRTYRSFNAQHHEDTAAANQMAPDYCWQLIDF